MTIPHDPESMVAQIGAELDAISSRVAAVSKQVSALRTMVSRPSAADRSAQPPDAGAATSSTAAHPVPPPTAAPAYAPGYYPQPAIRYPALTSPYDAYPNGPYFPLGPQPAQFPAPPLPPKKSVGERVAAASERGLVGRMLAAAGVAITLTGIVLLLVLASEAGLLRPPLRVAGGAILAAALYGLGFRIGRRAEQRTGASALVATGVAAALFVVVASTSIYHWLPAAPGLVLAAVVTAAGLSIAARWDSQPLAITVGVALLVFAPFVNGGVDSLLVGFLLVYAAATVPLQLGRDWTALYAVNTAATALPLLYAAGDSSVPKPVLSALLAVNVLIALGSAILLLRTSTRPVSLALVSAGSAVPALRADLAPGQWPTVVQLGAVTALFLAAAATGVRLPNVTIAVRSVWLSAGAVGLLCLIAGIVHGDSRVLVYLAVTVVLALAIGRAGELDPTVRAIATVWTALSVVAVLGLNPLGWLLDADAPHDGGQVPLAVAAALGVGAVGALGWGWVRVLGLAQSLPILIVTGLTGLGLFTVLCVTAGALITGGSDGGFRGGHVVATIAYAIAGGAVLRWARRLPSTDRGPLLVVGLTVVTGAVAKLFLFDLAALAGVFRVIAFLVTGLILLGLGVVYAQSLTGNDEDKAVE